jgi:hypothetical protein
MSSRVSPDRPIFFVTVNHRSYIDFDDSCAETARAVRSRSDVSHGTFPTKPFRFDLQKLFSRPMWKSSASWSCA